MLRQSRLLQLTALGLSIFSSASSAQAPQTTTYTASLGDVPVATLTQTIEQTDNDYRIHLNASINIAFPSLNLNGQSHGQWQQHYPLPQQFSYSLTFNDEERSHSVTDFPAGSLDILSLQLALEQDLSHNTLPDAYHVTLGGHSKSYPLTLQQPERITTAIGDYDTLVLTSHRQEDHVKVWLAPALDYRIVQAVYEKENKILINLNIKSIG